LKLTYSGWTVRTPRLMSHHSSKSNLSYSISLHRLLHPVSFYLRNNILIYSTTYCTSYHSINEVSFIRTKDTQMPIRPTEHRSSLLSSDCAETFSFLILVALLTSMMIMTLTVSKLQQQSRGIPRHLNVCTGPSYRLQPTSEHAWEPVRSRASRRSLKGKQGETTQNGTKRMNLQGSPFY
jgi:hypothetical protein